MDKDGGGEGKKNHLWTGGNIFAVCRGDVISIVAVLVAKAVLLVAIYEVIQAVHQTLRKMEARVRPLMRIPGGKVSH